MKNILIIILSAFYLTACSQNVKLVQDDLQKKVDVFIDGKLFTSYCYPENMGKPFLYPVNAPNGTVITRGYPIAPRKGERVDHPHQVGLWFNHGNVNGLDFWNNSSAIPAERKDTYDPRQEQVVYNLKKGESITLIHRFVVKAGAEINNDEADRIFKDFSETY